MHYAVRHSRALLGWQAFESSELPALDAAGGKSSSEV
jgi:hypothetical protein